MATEALVKATCPDCGAEITHAVTANGERVPLEKWTDSTGPNRYRVVNFTPLTVEPVSESSPIDAYPDHRLDCPAHGNGIRR